MTAWRAVEMKTLPESASANEQFFPQTTLQVVAEGCTCDEVVAGHKCNAQLCSEDQIIPERLNTCSSER